MGKDYCSIKDCHNTAGCVGRFGKIVRLHHLPKEKSLRSAWVRAISKKSYNCGTWTRVCSDHFPEGDGRTWKHTVPTLNLPQKQESAVNKRKTNNSQPYEDYKTKLVGSCQIMISHDNHLSKSKVN